MLAVLRNVDGWHGTGFRAHSAAIESVESITPKMTGRWLSPVHHKPEAVGALGLGLRHCTKLVGARLEIDDEIHATRAVPEPDGRGDARSRIPDDAEGHAGGTGESEATRIVCQFATVEHLPDALGLEQTRPARSDPVQHHHGSALQPADIPIPVGIHVVVNGGSGHGEPRSIGARVQRGECGFRPVAASIAGEREHGVVGCIAHQVVAIDEPVFPIRVELDDGVGIVVHVDPAAVAIDEKKLAVGTEILAEAELVEAVFERNLGRVAVPALGELVHTGCDLESRDSDEFLARRRLHIGPVRVAPTLLRVGQPPGVSGFAVVPQTEFKPSRVFAASIAVVAKARGVTGTIAKRGRVVLKTFVATAFHERVVALGKRPGRHMLRDDGAVGGGIFARFPRLHLGAEAALAAGQILVDQRIDTVVVAFVVACEKIDAQQRKGGVVEGHRIHCVVLRQRLPPGNVPREVVTGAEQCVGADPALFFAEHGCIVNEVPHAANPLGRGFLRPIDSELVRTRGCRPVFQQVSVCSIVAIALGDLK